MKDQIYPVAFSAATNKQNEASKQKVRQELEQIGGYSHARRTEWAKNFNQSEIVYFSTVLTGI